MLLSWKKNAIACRWHGSYGFFHYSSPGVIVPERSLSPLQMTCMKVGTFLADTSCRIEKVLASGTASPWCRYDLLRSRVPIFSFALASPEALESADLDSDVTVWLRPSFGLNVMVESFPCIPDPLHSPVHVSLIPDRSTWNIHPSWVLYFLSSMNCLESVLSWSIAWDSDRSLRVIVSGGWPWVIRWWQTKRFILRLFVWLT